MTTLPNGARKAISLIIQGETDRPSSSRGTKKLRPDPALVKRYRFRGDRGHPIAFKGVLLAEGTEKRDHSTVWYGLYLTAAGNWPTITREKLDDPATAPEPKHDYPQDGAYRGHVTLYQENIIQDLMVRDRVTGLRVRSETLVQVLVASGLFTEAEAREGIQAQIALEEKWLADIDRDHAVWEAKQKGRRVGCLIVLDGGGAQKADE